MKSIVNKMLPLRALALVLVLWAPTGAHANGAGAAIATMLAATAANAAAGSAAAAAGPTVPVDARANIGFLQVAAIEASRFSQLNTKLGLPGFVSDRRYAVAVPTADTPFVNGCVLERKGRTSRCTSFDTGQLMTPQELVRDFAGIDAELTGFAFNTHSEAIMLYYQRVPSANQTD